ncbi:hypothetical protein PHYC_02227 [Phycisphaerales bacterium]|nr:hypothetical protein PHYC_02227 [Phycisphaerales bacterium]
MPNIHASRLLLVSGLTLAATLAGCVAGGEPRGRGIVLDGDIGEWREGAAATCDSRFLYLRFTVDGEQYSLQSSPRPVAVFLDTDADPTTGVSRPEGPLAGMGIDVEVQLSPRRDDGRPGRGATILTTDQDGVRTQHKPADFDFAVSPTYASSWYEVRLSRSPRGAALPSKGMGGTGAAAGVVAVLGADGEVDAWADPFRVVFDQEISGEGGAPTLPPAKPGDGVRVISWNIERSSPVSNPEPFRRILAALEPDIVLMQEWEEGDESTVIAWFEAAGMTGWSVRKSEGDLSTGGGVLVASRFPIEPFGAAGLSTGGERGQKPVRFVAGVVRSPVGDILAGSTHLKCCGSKDSPEDRQRMAEAKAINALLRASMGARDLSLRVISGDLNLVGSRPPLDLLRAGLDVDGSDLDIADALVLGDLAYSTWRDPKTDFPPGRLDYVMFSDSTADGSSAFVFDAARLSDRSLATLGLRPEDSAASDHLPVVVDLRPLR